MSARCHPADLVLCGVELDVDDAGEDVVRDREGVLVRESGRRKEMFRSLSKGEAYQCFSVRPTIYIESSRHTWGSERRLME